MRFLIPAAKSYKQKKEYIGFLYFFRNDIVASMYSFKFYDFLEKCVTSKTRKDIVTFLKKEVLLSDEAFYKINACPSTNIEYFKGESVLLGLYLQIYFDFKIEKKSNANIDIWVTGQVDKETGFIEAVNKDSFEAKLTEFLADSSYVFIAPKDNVEYALNSLTLKNLKIQILQKNDELSNILQQKKKTVISVDFNDFSLLRDFLFGCGREYNTQESIYFSKSIIEKVNKHIEILTKDQLEIIKFLRGRERVAIAGCAGSGKTLIALEKSIRLDKAGLRTLLVCHNIYLAKHLQKLTEGTGVKSIDFCSLIEEIINKKAKKSTWTHYEEPTETELEQAIDIITESKNGFRCLYDAIIVDEGQDFKESWWLIIEFLLKNEKSSILYIFYDDNQTLLPHPTQCPIEDAPYSLSKNCRNAGKIFELVRQFYPTSPEISLSLADEGVVREFNFSKSSLVSSLNTEIANDFFLKDLLKKQKVTILTTEEMKSVNNSVLSGVSINLPSDYEWQYYVKTALQLIFSSYRYRIPFINLTIPTLSQETFPSEQDVNNVALFLSDMTNCFSWRDWPIQIKKYRKHIINKKQSLDKLLYKKNPVELLSFFTLKNWNEYLPIDCYTIRPHWNCTKPQDLPLYSISLFKGLESEAVILFIHPELLQFGDDFYKKYLYVGYSRAKIFLYIIKLHTQFYKKNVKFCYINH